MKRLLVLILITATFLPISAQRNLSLKECLSLAEKASPLNRASLIQQSISLLKEQSLSRSRLPMFQVSGQATYQSDVFSLPFAIPGQEMPEIPKDQYRIALGIQQSIYDGGRVKSATEEVKRDREIELQAIKVDLFKIKETINQLYFSSLLLQENVKLLQNSIKELDAQYKIIEARVKGGVLFAGSGDLLLKQKLLLEQKIIELTFQRKSLLDLLSSWIEEPVTDETVLAMPLAPTIHPGAIVPLNRPELRLFALQLSRIEASKNSITSPILPRVSAFANLGIGNPNPFNFFDVEWGPYYQVGLKVSWKIWDYGISDRQKSILSLNQNLVKVRKDNFEKYLNAKLQAEQIEMGKYEKLIAKDQEILKIQASIVKRSFAQFQNGVISSTDYITQINAETQAKLNLQVHQIQQVQSQISTLSRSGNF